MKKILVAYDGGEAALKGLNTAADLAQALGATVSVVSVGPVHGGRIGLDPWDDSEVHAKELTEARRLLRERGIDAALLEPVGEPAPTIERIAREGEFDTIILGSPPPHPPAPAGPGRGAPAGPRGRRSFARRRIDGPGVPPVRGYAPRDRSTESTRGSVRRWTTVTPSAAKAASIAPATSASRSTREARAPQASATAAKSVGPRSVARTPPRRAPFRGAP